jgi:hypothetical protein
MSPFLKILTKDRILFILVQKWKGEENEYLMGRQYEHVFIGDSDHYGFLPYHAGECIDPMAEERIRGFQIADCRFHRSIWFLKFI